MKINNFEFDFRIRKTVKFTVSSWHNYMDSLASLTRLSIGYLFATICSQRCLRFGSNELHKWCTQTESQKWTFPLIKRSYVTLLILSQMSYTHTIVEKNHSKCETRHWIGSECSNSLFVTFTHLYGQWSWRDKQI